MAVCAIGLGSNLGDSYATLEKALQILDETSGITVELRSQLYQTKPVGPPQPDFLNGCAILQTTLSPEQLLQQLLRIEADFGRVRRQRWGPRCLDLDLLLFEDAVIQTPALTIPHPRMHERAFVLVPLQEIAAHWVHPTLGKPVKDLIAQVDLGGIQCLV
jgi:2-amino-4-hydroxy-6-hydroxymethyldihydropteridine diphosphokinase